MPGDRSRTGSSRKALGAKALMGALALALLSLAFGPASAPAQETDSRIAAAGPWAANSEGRVRLIAARAGVNDESEILLGLHFQLNDGWKIYWRSPGDAGLPPEIQWTRAENLKSAEIAWPLPHRFSLFGLQTFGYGGEVVLPLRAQVDDAAAPLRLNANLTYLACAEICIPQEETLGLALPASADGEGAGGGLIREALARVPGDGDDVGLRLERAVLTGEPDQPSVTVVARSTRPFQAVDVLAEGPPGFAFGKPETEIRDNGREAQLTLPVTQSASVDGVLEGKLLTLTIADPERDVAMEATVIARHADALSRGAAGGETSLLGLAGMMALALLGGLILNLMPCVLPVLSIKLLSAVSHGGRASGDVRLSFLASAAGILASFLAIAGGLLALKGAGLAVGWGIQFQQPVFLAVMAVIVTLFALNLFGLFEVHLPGRLSDAAATAGQGRGHKSLTGAFLTGAFATLLATPCSAPFLGTAVGFALSRGTVEILLIFTALGLGLALPYLLVAAFPALATRLPRPGPWMLRVKQILGVALAATAVWLISVLWQQAGESAALLIAAALIAMPLVFLMRRRGTATALVPGLLALLAAAAVSAPVFFSGAGGMETAKPAEGDWRRLDETAIARHVAEGRTVFVDVTAEWCITCQVNKRLVIDTKSVRDRLDDPEVVAMRGDWTRPDEAIARYLRGFGRYGIPFNAVYGPGAPEGIALPEILSVEAVTRALRQAKGKTSTSAEKPGGENAGG